MANKTEPLTTEQFEAALSDLLKGPGAALHSYYSNPSAAKAIAVAKEWKWIREQLDDGVKGLLQSETRSAFINENEADQQQLEVQIKSNGYV